MSHLMVRIGFSTYYATSKSFIIISFLHFFHLCFIFVVHHFSLFHTRLFTNLFQPP